MAYAQLQGTLALVEAVRELSARMDTLTDAMREVEHSNHFAFDPPPPHTHALADIEARRATD